MSIKTPTYSDIIAPDLYEKLMTEQHLYIAASDKAIKGAVEMSLRGQTRRAVLEIGCGPGRVTSLVASIPGIDLRAIDLDARFIAYAHTRAMRDNLNAVFAVGDATSYKDDRAPLRVCYSQGMHHHVRKGADTHAYLSNIAAQLADDGVFILSDEFLPDYATPQGRHVRIVVWYAHIIANALDKGFVTLAREEAKTLLDDLQDDDELHVKTQEQIDLVLASAGAINRAAWRNHKPRRNNLVREFLENLGNLRNVKTSGDPTLDLSRGDFKICDRVFKEEVAGAGLKITHKDIFGWMKLSRNIGGLVVYTLKKA